VEFLSFFSAEGFELQAVGKEADFGSRRLKPGVKKYGLFQELFFVAHQQVKGDWAICNKRFVREFSDLVI
jgi:hypothetical protein